jgi:hypothetical protein
MNLTLFHSTQRNTMRRAVKTPCWAVSLSRGRLLGERLLDLSPEGMFLECRSEVSAGDGVFIVFKAPGSGSLWLRADAEVARVIEGRRDRDRAYGAGLKITRLKNGSYFDLGRCLKGLPPPLPGRHLRVDYAETIRRLAYSRTLSGVPLPQLS